MRPLFRGARSARPPALSRRGLLGVSATGLTTGLVTGAAVRPAAATGPARARPARTEPGRSGIRLRWLGNNGWEIRVARPGSRPATVLVDPWLTRFRTGTYTEEGADPATELSVREDVIDRHRLRADQILVTHGHYDHLPDVPYLAGTTGATVLGTESHVNMLLALGAPEEQLSVVSGGEYLRFAGYSVRVLRSLHSMTGERARVPFPGTRPGGPPPRPRTIADLVEGGTLAYAVTCHATGFTAVNFGGSNFSAADLDGLAPDLAMIQPGGASVHEYVPRLLSCLDHPPHVVPTHWDDFDEPLDEPAVDWGGLADLREAVAAASPDTRFTVVDHLETFTP
ncbi:MBL fold metallo-hydrolase [Streptomyces sp. TRM 70361]|uniref:MBL fold metallo-hydrolase n=1 Tax=Streptomyces sp. TRM 70361 TaxID=3116553 RepID=UPI002E7C1003|nr:MBL fold metallo-hydrolase [Streptomyces sp. TRM 70361]MEE1941279.1 MBL fold metallo-hydrolase [Streptomyces sp. TRM 70361]